VLIPVFSHWAHDYSKIGMKCKVRFNRRPPGWPRRRNSLLCPVPGAFTQLPEPAIPAHFRIAGINRVTTRYLAITVGFSPVTAYRPLTQPALRKQMNKQPRQNHAKDQR